MKYVEASIANVETSRILGSQRLIQRLQLCVYVSSKGNVIPPLIGCQQELTRYGLTLIGRLYERVGLRVATLPPLVVLRQLQSWKVRQPKTFPTGILPVAFLNEGHSHLLRRAAAADTPICDNVHVEKQMNEPSRCSRELAFFLRANVS